MLDLEYDDAVTPYRVAGDIIAGDELPDLG